MSSADAMDKVVRHAKALRRDLHAHPELRFEETRTASIVREELDRLGISWESCTPTGTVARLAADLRGPHRAFRADLDALPIVEQTGRSYASKYVGRMHACGHDGHTASLLGAAAWLKQHERELPGPVSLIFQPGEEGGHGAQKMIEEGVLNGVDTIFGYHNWPPIPLGRAACIDGTIMAANGHFKARAVGRGGHASQPEACIDPIVVLSQFVTQVQHVVSRLTAPQDAAVVTVGTFSAGTASNIIPDHAECTGTVRAPTAAARDLIADRCEAVLRGVCIAAGAEPEWSYEADYPATQNDPEAAEEARRALRNVLGSDCLWNARLPIMASEDFSYYAKHAKACFILLGAGPPGGSGTPCHSAQFDFNDALIPAVIRLWSSLAGL